ncbi:MAG TPA: hypothetical protein VFW66_06095 [Gemmatimonadales bacterium]|nr:hypothetical protein [Gemmatimonadales bacterium]
MARTLTVARAAVSPAAEAEYLRTIAELARVAEPRGRRLWLFRSAERPDLFLECSESANAATHRAVATLPDDEARLEARLGRLAAYGPDARERWLEVRV